MGRMAVISWSRRKAPTCESGAERRFCSEAWRRRGRKRAACVRIRDTRWVCASDSGLAFGEGLGGFELELGLELLDWKRRFELRIRGLWCEKEEGEGRGARVDVRCSNWAACRCQRAWGVGIAVLP
jgi:hypothetical protein